MLLHHAPAPQPQADAKIVRIGVGIDTSRYGHYAAFLRDDLQPAAGEVQFVESAAGYAELRSRFEQIVSKLGTVHFAVRLDVAGQYADNLLHFLHTLQGRLANATFTISCGDTQRNKNYRAALFGDKKSDPVEARAAARYALSENPAPVKMLPAELRTLRQAASRLQAVVRQRTRLVNQFHLLLALTFPELALLVKDIATGWVLTLCERYPTAKLLAAASAHDLGHIPYLPEKLIDALLEHARTSIACLDDDTVAELVRDQVRQLRDVRARQLRLEKALVDAYRQLPDPNHLDSIPGIGEVTAAILTAFIRDIDRFQTPNKLVDYFGARPIEVSSGVDRDGKPRSAKRYVMSRRGNDLVRRYLWMAALSAVRYNPAVRPLYARVVAKHPDQKAIAIGHAMRKLLHLAFAIWKTKKPFDKSFYRWDAPAHIAPRQDRHEPAEAQDQAAGLKDTAMPALKEVTAACEASLAHDAEPGQNAFVDFAHVKAQLPIGRVLDHLNLTRKLQGAGAQKRCACPIHCPHSHGRTFSVNLDDNVFQCFSPRCQKKGDVIDLWAALHHQDLRQAALDLVRTFALEAASTQATEKRNG
ncbi:MAG TPA: transposase [Steroidobacteraceae bacterium]|nr:transposase [Steroidobacteraceae bacterium]